MTLSIKTQLIGSKKHPKVGFKFTPKMMTELGLHNVHRVTFHLKGKQLIMIPIRTRNNRERVHGIRNVSQARRLENAQKNL